jgi:hypothetical protein
MAGVYEHNPGDHEDPLAGPTWTVGVIGTILLIVIVLGTAAICYSVLTSAYVERVVDEPDLEVTTLRGKQIDRLNAAPHIELRPENPEGEQSIVIPIDRAMRLVAKEAGKSGETQ